MKKDYSGFPGDCSEDQLKVLGEFRTAVRNMGCTDPPYDDPYLLRFLRARKFDLTKALQMWTNFIKWRSENKIDDIDTYAFSEVDQVKQFYPHGYFRVDKQGRPIYIERIGHLKIQQLFKVTSQDRLVKYYCQSYERLINEIFPGCSKAAGTSVSQTVTILDLKGGSIGMVSKQVYDFVQLASKIGQDYYPEILGQMFIVNAPMLFTGVWTVIKPWIDVKTRDKIKILGGKYEKELFAVIDPENLPDFLGGKVPASEYGANLDNEQGPWLNDKNQDDDKDDEEAKEDFSDLKNALSGIKIGGGAGGASVPKPQLNDQAQAQAQAQTQVNPVFNDKQQQIADTPFSTQVDADDEH